jgi:hypothetical protein
MLVECPNCARSANLRVHEVAPVYIKGSEAIIGARLDINCENCGHWWEQCFYGGKDDD